MTRFALTLIAMVMAATSALAEGVTHYVAIHVSQNDPKVMNMALNNAANVTKYYESKGDTVEIELVAYGPGLTMFVPGKSPVADRISTMSLQFENLSFSACGNTLRKMSAKAGHDIVLMDEAGMVPSGVVRLIELQEQGYAYVRP
ncbi:MAG: DsrE family protein [Rhodobacterales bacterium]|nr:DsrE family protein [Rhodobacterales bacterium]